MHVLGAATPPPYINLFICSFFFFVLFGQYNLNISYQLTGLGHDGRDNRPVEPGGGNVCVSPGAGRRAAPRLL